MATEREVQELVARCVSGVVFYINSGTGPRAKDVLAADAEAAARLVSRWGLGKAATAESLLRPVEAELVARYGPVRGRKLSGEFAAAFMRSTVPSPLLTPVPA